MWDWVKFKKMGVNNLLITGFFINILNLTNIVLIALMFEVVFYFKIIQLIISIHKRTRLYVNPMTLVIKVF